MRRGGVTQNVKPSKLFFTWQSSAISKSYTFEKDCFALVLAGQCGGSSNPTITLKINGTTLNQVFTRNMSLVSKYTYFLKQFKAGDVLDIAVSVPSGNYPRIFASIFKIGKTANMRYIGGGTFSLQNFTKNYALIMLISTRGNNGSTHSVELKKNNTTVTADESYSVSSSSDIFNIYYLDCSDAESIDWTCITSESYADTSGYFIQ